MHENSVCCLYYYITLISAYNVVSHENDDDGLVPQKTMAIIILKYVCVAVLGLFWKKSTHELFGLP